MAEDRDETRKAEEERYQLPYEWRYHSGDSVERRCCLSQIVHSPDCGAIVLLVRSPISVVGICTYMGAKSMGSAALTCSKKIHQRLTLAPTYIPDHASRNEICSAYLLPRGTVIKPRHESLHDAHVTMITIN